MQEYEEALHAAACRVVHFELKEENGFRAGAEFLEALDEDLDMLFLCNPNNPTGQLMTREFLLKIIRRLQIIGDPAVCG